MGVVVSGTNNNPVRVSTTRIGVFAENPCFSRRFVGNAIFPSSVIEMLAMTDSLRSDFWLSSYIIPIVMRECKAPTRANYCRRVNPADDNMDCDAYSE